MLVLFVIAQNCKCSSKGEWIKKKKKGEWINKLCYIYTRDYSPGTKREWTDDTGNRKDESQNIIPCQKMPDTKDIITCHIIPSYETLWR